MTNAGDNRIKMIEVAFDAHETHVLNANLSAAIIE